MKLLFTMPYRQEGGVHSFCQSVIPFLSCEVIVFRRGARQNEKRWMQPWRMLQLMIGFCYKLLKERPDAVFINTSLRTKSIFRDGMLVILAKLLVGRVATYIHGFDLKLVEHRALRMGFYRSDIIFVLSQAYRKALVTAGYKGRLVVSVNPVDRELYEAAPSSSNVHETARELLFLSRVEEEKGIFTLLRAFELLLKDDPQLRLVVAGSGSALNRAKKYAHDRGMGGVRFVGFVDGREKINTYRSSDIYLFASKSEGMPISVLEAMLFGLPVVTRPVGGVRDFFVDGKMGVIVREDRPELFAAATRALLGDHRRRRRISLHNIRFARQAFDPSKVATCLENEIKTMMQKNRA